MSVAEYGWKDLIIPIAGLATGSGTPAMDVFGSTGGVKQMKFGVGDSVYFAGHVNHDLLVGSTGFPHVHWSTSGTDVNTVKWQMTCLIAKGHNQANFGTDVIISLEEAAQGTAWRHMITEDAVGFDMLEPDTIWLGELKRITNGGTDNADDVFAFAIDIHYQTQQHSTLNRTPNFYA